MLKKMFIFISAVVDDVLSLLILLYRKMHDYGMVMIENRNKSIHRILITLTVVLQQYE